MAKKNDSKSKLIEELKGLLLPDNNREDDGILAQAGRVLSGDLVVRKISRAKAILGEL